jgi:hypothetical protein
MVFLIQISRQKKKKNNKTKQNKLEFPTPISYTKEEKQKANAVEV